MLPALFNLHELQSGKPFKWIQLNLESTGMLYRVQWKWLLAAALQGLEGLQCISHFLME